jgi:hypothetical protein
MRFVGLIAAVAALSFAAATSAGANVITVDGTATVTCTASCQGVVGGSITDMPGPGLTGTLGMLSNMTADRYEFSPANPEEEALALSFLAGTSFTTGVRTNVDGMSDSMFSFTTSALWVALKLGSSTIFIFNNTGGELTVDWARNNLRGGGLSHITEFGETVIPVPGAVWLMGAGLAGLGFTRRRKTA